MMFNEGKENLKKFDLHMSLPFYIFFSLFGHVSFPQWIASIVLYSRSFLPVTFTSLSIQSHLLLSTTGTLLLKRY